MKKSSIIASTLVALGIVSQASAQIPVYITGSTAFRSQTVSGILAAFDGGAATNTITRGNTDPKSAPYAILEGNIGGVPYHVFTLWSGSEAGLAALSGTTVNDVDFNTPPNTVPLANIQTFFLKDDGSVTGTSSSAPGATETNNVAQAPDLAMADTSKAVSFSKAAPIGDVGIVGIVPFTWVKNTNTAGGTYGTAWTNFSNISHAQAKNALGGPQPAGLFTGKVADNTYTVYTTGRNKGSGTRVNTLADTGYGIGNGVDQFALNPKETTPGSGIYTGAFGGGSSVTSLVDIGNAGFESGGDVSKELSLDGCSAFVDPNSAATGILVIGYLGISDATANSIGVPQWLTLNGVLESDGAVSEGQYSFWGHEHMYKKSGLSGSQLTYATTLFNATKAQVTGNSAALHSKGIATTFMNCDKGDTGYPVHN